MPAEKVLNGYIAISLKDLEEGKRLPFDIYLYLKKNQKIIIYRKKDSVLETDRRKTLRRKVECFYIRDEDRGTYYKYMSNIFVDAIENGELTDEQRSERVKMVARGLLEDVFIREGVENEQFENNIQGVVREIIAEISDNKMKDIYEKLLSMVSDDNTTYAHSVNVASYSVMFCFCLGIVKPKELSNIAIAAVLHDIFLACLPSDVVTRYRRGDVLNMSETLIIHRHVLGAEDIIKSRYRKFSSSIMWIIRQHHEQPDGKGYPIGLKGENIGPLARVLSIANIFDNTVMHLRIRGLKPHPRDVLQQMFDRWDEKNQIFDRTLFEEIVQTIGVSLQFNEAEPSDQVDT